MYADDDDDDHGIISSRDWKTTRTEGILSGIDKLQFTNYRKYYSYYNDYELILVVFRISSSIWKEVYPLIASTEWKRETNGKLSTLSYANFGAVSGHNCYFAECCMETE